MLVTIAAAIASMARAEADQARFRVTPQVVVPDLQAFTATGDNMGNGTGLIGGGGGFEPVPYRTQFLATGGDETRIEADPRILSGYDTWREGAFDGAEIEVLRIIDGKFVSVRRDRVAEGGYHASGWTPIMGGGRIIPSGTEEWLISWEGYNRREVPYYFMIRTLDRDGRMSEISQVVTLESPRKPGKIRDKQPFTRATLIDGPSGLAAPGNLRAEITAEGIGRLRWDPVPGAAGYAIFVSDRPPSEQRGYGIDLAGPGPAVRAGDLVILRTRFVKPLREKIVSNRLFGENGPRKALLPGPIGSYPEAGGPDWELCPHEAGTPVEDPGETYLCVDLSRGQSFELGLYNHTGTENGFYPVLDPEKTYRIEFWLRGTGEGWVDVPDLRIPGHARGLPQKIVPGPAWKKVQIDFQVGRLSQGRRSGVMQVILNAGGRARIDVDNLRIYRTDAPFMALLPEDQEILETSGMSLLRTHGFIKTGTSTYDVNQLLAAPGLNTVARGTTLPQTLAYLEKAGISPWLQIEPHLSREEWLALAEYLAAPFDPARDDPAERPWAARRVAQGHPEPWIDVFDTLWFEIGNETWNTIFRPWVFPKMREAGLLRDKEYSAGQVYGLYQNYVLSILQESPWWDRLAPKLVPVIGGWGGRDYGVEAAMISPRSRVLAHANYIGGWDSGEGPVREDAESYASILSFAPQMSRSARRYIEAVAGRPGLPMITGTYESGPGYAKNGLNNVKVTPEQKAAQERVMKGVAAGTATLDSFLTFARAGQSVQNYFMLRRGQEWASHAPWYYGGGAYPSWAWLALFNRVGLGDMLEVETLEVPRRDVPDIYWRKAMPDAPMAAAYATRQGDRLTVVVISRQVPDVPRGNAARLSVSLELPLHAVSSHRLYTMSGDYRTQNTTGSEAVIAGEDLPIPEDPSRLEIPDLGPGESQIHVFEGVRFDD